MLIPDRLWEQMTLDEQELVRDTIRGNRVKSKAVTCPHCGGSVQVNLSVEMTAVSLPSESKPKTVVLPAQGDGLLPKHYREMIEAARASGLLEHFHAAIKEQNPHSAPPDIDITFCKYWSLVLPVRLTSRQRDLLWVSYGQSAEAWGAMGVFVIVCDSEVLAFVPQRLLRSSVGNGQFQVSVRPQMEAWVKGRFGYVPVESRGFAAELRRQNIGKFGALVQ